MKMSLTENLQQGEQPGQRPGRKKKDNRPQTEPAIFQLTPEIIERLGHYVVSRPRAEHRKVTKSEVVERALDEFLRSNGF